MIIGIAVLSILLFIASVALFVQRRGLVILEEKYWDENRLHLDTQMNLEKANKRVSELSTDNDRLCFQITRNKQELEAAYQDLAKLTNGNADQEQQEEQGNFVRMRRVRPATAETYRNVFDLTVDGQRILEDLTSQFCKPSYVRGGVDAERESCYRAGQGSVVNRILAKINTANDPNYKEEQDND
ncbi:hypothetical protein [Acinetobacter baumannii]|uniref:Bbp19 family protein n=1 Tax=Acinetobacter baumannii TaxID=470 RepID=UPI00338F8945